MPQRFSWQGKVSASATLPTVRRPVPTTAPFSSAKPAARAPVHRAPAAQAMAWASAYRCPGMTSGPQFCHSHLLWPQAAHWRTVSPVLLPHRLPNPATNSTSLGRLRLLTSCEPCASRLRRLCERRGTATDPAWPGQALCRRRKSACCWPWSRRFTRPCRGPRRPRTASGRSRPARPTAWTGHGRGVGGRGGSTAGRFTLGGARCDV